MNYQEWAHRVDTITSETKHSVEPLGRFERLTLLGAQRAVERRSGALLAVPHPFYSSNVERIARFVMPLPKEDEADVIERVFTALFDLWPVLGEHPLFCIKMPFVGV
jgi:hypothetical protein